MTGDVRPPAAKKNILGRFLASGLEHFSLAEWGPLGLKKGPGHLSSARNRVDRRLESPNGLRGKAENRRVAIEGCNFEIEEQK